MNDRDGRDDPWRAGERLGTGAGGAGPGTGGDWQAERDDRGSGRHEDARDSASWSTGTGTDRPGQAPEWPQPRDRQDPWTERDDRSARQDPWTERDDRSARRDDAGWPNQAAQANDAPAAQAQGEDAAWDRWASGSDSNHQSGMAEQPGGWAGQGGAAGEAGAWADQSGAAGPQGGWAAQGGVAGQQGWAGQGGSGGHERQEAVGAGASVGGSPFRPLDEGARRGGRDDVGPTAWRHDSGTAQAEPEVAAPGARYAELNPMETTNSLTGAILGPRNLPPDTEAEARGQSRTRVVIVIMVVTVLVLILIGGGLALFAGHVFGGS